MFLWTPKKMYKIYGLLKTFAYESLLTGKYLSQEDFLLTLYRRLEMIDL